ncbi:hypothetical protein GCM10010124_32300 [Pilimelia terevasa]|uniref:DUF418 domain-containing protein n=1 Tax=Pilimelia terevasa TaxID=53372 RepID=A0A8J3BSR3_9ACTN|nr:DUF418 domain-containing protein [Pilimelia terevasa]GGK37160.1 hypothetical protein GCM10010124_32300 [Pilimelia terevasa]
MSTPDTSPGDAGTRRIATVDALRGLALFGILAVNITYFASQYRGTGVLDARFEGTVDRWTYLLTDALFETKFYLLFSFLFGYSFTLQITAASRRGAAFTPRFLRRVLGLFAIGAAHAVFLFHGDILMLYAALGLLLLPLRHLRPRTAAILGAALLVLATEVWFWRGVLVWHTGDPDGTDPVETSDTISYVEAAYQGSFSEIIAQRLDDVRGMAAILLDFQGPAALAMFLFGLAAGKLRLLADPMRYRAGLRWLLVAGAVVGLPGGVLYAFAGNYYADTALQYFAGALDFLASPVLAASYLAGAVLLFHRLPALARAFAPAGRMALTNYLSQSVFCAFVFTGYGLGLTGELAPLPVFGIAVALFAVQLAWSAYWLQAHQYGPAEWALRGFSYLEIPRWRRPPVWAVPAAPR